MTKIEYIISKIRKMTDDELEEFIIDKAVICVKDLGLKEYKICDEVMCQHCWFEEMN